jgi:hypothetical protein
VIDRHLLGALLLALPGVLQARVDVSTLDQAMAGPRTQIAVLGSVHLSTLPQPFHRASLQGVVDRLVAYKPDIVTIEAIPGEACDFTARYPGIYQPEDMQPYCVDTAPAKAATGLDVPSAVAEIVKTLKTWPAAPTPAQRRHLAALFLAAGEHASAFVQWLQLPDNERHGGDGLNDALVTALNAASMQNSENLQIAAQVAARLGLQRVVAIDDHTGDNVDVADAAAYGAAIQKAWDTAAAKLAPIRKRESELTGAADSLALYRYINREDVLRTVIDGDFGAALRDTSPQHYGQIYVAGWETRNLRMVANIRAALREHPGARVLAVVGSTHKAWFDMLLGRMQGVDVVDVERVLK